MQALTRRVLGGKEEYKYSRLGRPEGAGSQSRPRRPRDLAGTRKAAILLVMLLALAAWVVVLATGSQASSAACNSVDHGYNCEPRVSHSWGQYSPYFSVKSDISPAVPHGCEVTFAQILSRHGARDPTASKTKAYNATIQKIQANVHNFTGRYAFLADYEYTLGADQLTPFGQQEMVDSGIKYYERYRSLASKLVPFVRSSGENRVVESAQNWTQGFRAAKHNDPGADHGPDAYPTVDVVIPEGAGVNNTLDHDLCSAFESGADSAIAGNAQAIWADIFAVPIQARLNHDLAGANLSLAETIYILDLCPFNTVASPATPAALSPFCALFTPAEFRSYAYYQTLGKYYGYGDGNPLGPTQGVGFANELIARLTDSPVADHTSTNATLDAPDASTFPLRRALYADFSHDNDITAILAALGLYNLSSASFPLSNTSYTPPARAAGFAAAWLVPFASRAYFEKLQCASTTTAPQQQQQQGGRKTVEEEEEEEEELVRVIVNDRVLPLDQCGADALGRCRLPAFVDSLGFARSGGAWGACFTADADTDADAPT